MRGRKPTPTAIRRAAGNPGKRGYNADEPKPPAGALDCPAHLNDPARQEWERVCATLERIGVVTMMDRAALAAYCQAYGRWVEAEQKLQESPLLFKTPSGYVQQSPWLSVANKQLELMGRFMAELGMTPASRARVAAMIEPEHDPITKIELVMVSVDENGRRTEQPMQREVTVSSSADARDNACVPRQIELTKEN